MSARKTPQHSTLRLQWDRLYRLPFGRAIVSRIVGFAAPYAAGIGARIESLESGRARVSIPDRRKVRNHLKSIHAMAMANLAELTANMAVLYSLPVDMRMIVTDFAIRYEKKARGPLTAVCEAPSLLQPVAGRVELQVAVYNARGERVAVANQTCLLGGVQRKDDAPLGVAA